MAGNKSAGCRLDCSRKLFFPASMKTVLSAALVFASWAAHAQGTGEIYAAPGMAVRIAKPAPVPQSKPKELVPPVAILPRFWRSTDNAFRNTGSAQLLYFIQYNTKYPAAAKSIEFEGKIYVRTIIDASGEPSKIEVINRNKTVAAQTDALNSLEVESMRVVRAMRFQPQAGVADTIVVPIVYGLP